MGPESQFLREFSQGAQLTIDLTEIQVSHLASQLKDFEQYYDLGMQENTPEVVCLAYEEICDLRLSMRKLIEKSQAASLLITIAHDEEFSESGAIEVTASISRYLYEKREKYYDRLKVMSEIDQQNRPYNFRSPAIHRVLICARELVNDLYQDWMSAEIAATELLASGTSKQLNQ
jgi:hypothetical protein